MAQRFYGSICLSDLLACAKAAHSAFSRANNGKAYANIDIYINDKPDQYGNSLVIQLHSKKEMYEQEGHTYIGNCKLSDNRPQAKAAPAKKGSKQFADDDLPF